MTDLPDIEAEAIATAAADLGDRFAIAPVTVSKPSAVGRSGPSSLGAFTERRFLTGSDEIVEHMARDILAARRGGDHATLVDLTEHGWTIAQSMRWGSRAHVLALDPGFAAQDVVERLGASPRGGDEECGAAVALALGVTDETGGKPG